jgi:hypothetical protein
LPKSKTDLILESSFLLFKCGSLKPEHSYESVQSVRFGVRYGRRFDDGMISDLIFYAAGELEYEYTGAVTGKDI